MKKRIVVFSLIIVIVLCIAMVQIPGIYAIPTDYSDFEGIVLSKDANIHNQLPTNFCYTFRTVDDPMTWPYPSPSTSSSISPNFIAELVTFNYHGMSITSGVKINTSNNPYPNISIPADVNNNIDSFWNYIFAISKYWKIYSSTSNYYNSPVLFLKPYDYKEPTFEFSCNPNNIEVGQTSICELKVNYYSKIDSLDFKLNTSDYEISNIELGNDFENLEKSNDIYSISSKNTLDSSENGRTTTVLKFIIKSNKNDITDTNNIKIEDLHYRDELSESPTKALAATVNQAKKNNIVDLKNPKTKNNVIAITILLTIIVISIIIVKKKKKV